MAQEGHTFGQKQPPLYVTIQKILDKYPDGQIFKVCYVAICGNFCGFRGFASVRKNITSELAGIYETIVD